MDAAKIQTLDMFGFVNAHCGDNYETCDWSAGKGNVHPSAAGFVALARKMATVVGAIAQGNITAKPTRTRSSAMTANDANVFSRGKTSKAGFVPTPTASAARGAPAPAPPFSCPSGGYCGSCPTGYANWDSIHPMLFNTSPGLKQFHSSVVEAVAMFKQYPGIRTDDVADTHMSVQYLCCLNSTQMATVRHVVAAHSFPKLAVRFGEVIC